ncbi:hypothetical protein [Subtercola sp. RTI3]|uniref:hypothetical protein n=1 Tax=Subtercola sp. RTI3 TaxID=3048639 RepID=UPI002B22F5FD|nr:hypothetical protein [Subtercola sp. RTI3]MEA9985654.1 hypothetical protein [Subtercola sp. RTI3]
MTAQYDFTLGKSESFDRPLTWYGGDGNVIDLTGMTAVMTIKDDESDAVVVLTSEAGITLGGEAGTIELSITPVQSAELDFITGRYDLMIYKASSNYAKRLIDGTVTLARGSTS